VCSTIICNIIYIQNKLLQYYYLREIFNIQTLTRDVQDLGVDNLGPAVSLLYRCVLVLGTVHPKRPTGGPSTIEIDFPTHPARSVRDF